MKKKTKKLAPRSSRLGLERDKVRALTTDSLEQAAGGAKVASGGCSRPH